jgi:galactose mutarotase-like enzyme
MLGDLTPSDVDAELVREWIASLMDKGLASNTINRKLSSIRTYYKFLLRRGEVAVDPLRKITGPKKKKPLPVFLREGEMNRLLDDMDFGEGFEGCRDHMIIEMFYATGMRLSELIGLDDKDANFPGNVTATVTYALTRDNAIDINYKATTDKKTVINMTNHSYFNLSGNPANPATDHILYVNADSITPVDSTFMTTGEMMAVTETPFDFNTPKTIAPDVTNFENEQIKFGNGFDHNWVLNTKGDINQLAAKLTSPTSGITLEVYTNEPGIQVYTGNFLDGTVKGKKGITYPQRASVCLETQHYPDSPNKSQWPSVILEPGQTYHSQCIFKFGVEK